jgi:hypothetical protein
VDLGQLKPSILGFGSALEGGAICTPPEDCSFSSAPDIFFQELSTAAAPAHHAAAEVMGALARSRAPKCPPRQALWSDHSRPRRACRELPRRTAGSIPEGMQ